MPSIFDCLQRAVDAGELDKVRGRAAQDEFEQLRDRYATIYPTHVAETMAAEDLKEATRRAARSRKHAVVNQLQAMRRIKNIIEAADDPGATLRNLIEYSEGSGYTGESVASIGDALVSQVNGDLARVLQATSKRPGSGKSRNEALLANIIRELHGQRTGDTGASELAQSVKTVQSRLRRMFNAHGGDIGELADYGVAHSHDMRKLLTAGPEAWRADIWERLDWSRITNRSTGKPFAATPGDIPRGADAEAFLDSVYDAITTKGWNKKDPTMSVGGKALYNQRAEARELHFRDGDAWLEYNAKFGTSNPFDAMINGLHGIANDVAQMRVLGPNPRAGLEFAGQVADQRVAMEMRAAAGNAKALKAARRMRENLNAAQTRSAAMFAHIDGSANYPVRTFWANFFGGTRAFLTSVQLGSAMLSSVTDTVTLSAAAKAVGMNGRNVLSRQVGLMSKHATRETAARMGYIASTMAQTGMRSSRYFSDTWSSEITDRLADFTLRASGLNFWTDMGRVAFQMEFAGHLADNAARTFDQIDAPLQKLLRERGISAADWDLLRDERFLFRADNGATFLAPNYWRKAAADALPEAQADALASRLQAAIEEQVEIAIPSVSIEGRTVLVTGAEPGTFMGESQRSMVMYKSFALSLMLRQYRRFLDIPSPLDRTMYAAKMMAGLTLMGGLAIQLKELAKGRDPRPMDDVVFWQASVMQGGGLGLFGDFFAAEANRLGGSMGETLAGPVWSFVGDLSGPVVRNGKAITTGKHTSIGRDASNLVRYNTPVGSSLWYGRLAFDRIVADQIQDFLDPQATVAWRRAERRVQRDYGTRSWWQRGDLLPARPPELSNAIGSP